MQSKYEVRIMCRYKTHMGDYSHGVFYDGYREFDTQEEVNQFKEQCKQGKAYVHPRLTYIWSANGFDTNKIIKADCFNNSKFDEENDTWVDTQGNGYVYYRWLDIKENKPKINYQCRNELSYEICFDYKGHDYRIYYNELGLFLQRLDKTMPNWWDNVSWEADVYLEDLEAVIDEIDSPEAVAILDKILETEI